MEILCMHCQTMIAKRDTSSGGIQFDKWNISLRRANCAHWEQYPAQMFLTASLLERIERQAVRKFLVCDSTSRGADEALVVGFSWTNRRIRANCFSSGSLTRIYVTVLPQ